MSESPEAGSSLRWLHPPEMTAEVQDNVVEPALENQRVVSPADVPLTGCYAPTLELFDELFVVLRKRTEKRDPDYEEIAEAARSTVSGKQIH